MYAVTPRRFPWCHQEIYNPTPSSRAQAHKNTKVSFPLYEANPHSPPSPPSFTFYFITSSQQVVLDNPTAFGNPFQFEITFDCLQELEDDIEWKVIYVGSPETATHDQVLDEILVGPVPVGVNKFVLQADAPDPSTIPNDNILGVTVVLVTCSYKEQEFARIGYYVNNEYAEPYDPEVGPPSPLDLNKVVRTILADKPRVTRFPINWTGKVEQQQQQDQEKGVWLRKVKPTSNSTSRHLVTMMT